MLLLLLLLLYCSYFNPFQLYSPHPAGGVSEWLCGAYLPVKPQQRSKTQEDHLLFLTCCRCWRHHGSLSYAQFWLMSYCWKQLDAAAVVSKKKVPTMCYCKTKYNRCSGISLSQPFRNFSVLSSCCLYLIILAISHFSIFLSFPRLLLLPAHLAT